MAQHRHKRDANARRSPSAIQVAGPVAVLATLSAVAVGVLTATRPSPAPRTCSHRRAVPPLASPPPASPSAVTSCRARASSGRSREAEGSPQDAKREARQEAKREAPEQKATLKAVRSADSKLWTTTDLNLWTSAEGDARNVGVLDSLEKVLVTGRKDGDRIEVVIDGKSRWVTAGYLSDEKPTSVDEPASSAASAAPAPTARRCPAAPT